LWFNCKNNAFDLKTKSLVCTLTLCTFKTTRNP